MGAKPRKSMWETIPAERHDRKLKYMGGLNSHVGCTAGRVMLSSRAVIGKLLLSLICSPTRTHVIHGTVKMAFKRQAHARQSTSPQGFI
jgi:hypothetical protein